MNNTIVKILFALFIFANLTYAQKLSFPAINPSLEIEFPKSWDVKLDNDAEAGVIAMSEDTEVEINLWMVDQKTVDKDPAKAINSAIEEVESLVNEFLKDFKVVENKNGEIDGIKYVSIEGVGVDIKSKEETQVYAEILTPNEKNIFVMIYWASEEAENKNLKDINMIFDSVKKIK